ncbi:VOC family protein [Kitasatospora sp. A2-31]|uniref:VOC family protein n=1 Tax=Kitasatospora sp. A2-31 TaxID=2916414 RepID=UPI001EE8BB94|nr:VOC family protein [Kitasatospora sp. A2-31]MCG6493728.1 VOC family protein [Kitasatospora sp. A2-31]
MASILNPYIGFNGNAREAMEFYREVFGGELTVNTYGDFGQAEAGGGADRIMHSMLTTTASFTLMGADSPQADQDASGGRISVSVSGEDEGELRGYWEKLSAGGTVMVPMEKQMWGDIFGMCTDRYGITWLVDIIQPRS